MLQVGEDGNPGVLNAARCSRGFRGPAENALLASGGVPGARRSCHSERKASVCNEVISKGLRQRMLAQASLSSRLTI